MNESLVILFHTLKKEVGTGLALKTVSAVIYNILDDLETSGKGSTEKNIRKALKQKVKDYTEASKNNHVT